LRSQDGEATDDPARPAADLSVAVARLQAGASVRYAGQSLFYLTAAEYRLGAWDDALLHGELAVSLAHDTDRTGEFAFAHAYAAIVPAARGTGSWPVPMWRLRERRARTATATGKTARSNREVAAALFVSVKAVEFHLGHAFDTVGIRSRRALPGPLAEATGAAARRP